MATDDVKAAVDELKLRMDRGLFAIGDAIAFTNQCMIIAAHFGVDHNELATEFRRRQK